MYSLYSNKDLTILNLFSVTLGTSFFVKILEVSTRNAFLCFPNPLFKGTYRGTKIDYAAEAYILYIGKVVASKQKYFCETGTPLYQCMD
jgi:hypothetical protein